MLQVLVLVLYHTERRGPSWADAKSGRSFNYEILGFYCLLLRWLILSPPSVSGRDTSELHILQACLNLYSPSVSWHYKLALPCLFYFARIEPRTSYMQGKHSANWVIFPFPIPTPFYRRHRAEAVCRHRLRRKDRQHLTLDKRVEVEDARDMLKLTKNISRHTQLCTGLGRCGGCCASWEESLCRATLL